MPLWYSGAWKHDMLDFYLQLPAWIRMSIASLFLLTGLAMGVMGFMNRPTSDAPPVLNDRERFQRDQQARNAAGAFRGGLLFSVVGAVLIVACAKTNAEK